MKKLDVGPDTAGVRLDVFLSEVENITRSRAQSLIEDGAVLVSGKLREKNFRLHNGDTVTVEYPPVAPCNAKAENIPLDIIYEDDDVIVVNKPKGMVVHPAAGHTEGTLVSALIYHCGASLSGIGGEARPGIVHRIDKDTSGLIVAAKNDAAHLSLSQQLKVHGVARIYHAIALGKIFEPLTVDKPIARSPSDRKKMAVATGGREAITHVMPIEVFDCGASYVKCSLETGRTHQIRVHLSSIGHPILGDPLYGQSKSPVEKKYGVGLIGQCLHAKELTFLHPSTGKSMFFECPLPDYFKAVLEALRKTDEKNRTS
jgi:23S rRNA pseudouridine1911/1915/1917 synthase